MTKIKTRRPRKDPLEVIVDTCPIWGFILCFGILFLDWAKSFI